MDEVINRLLNIDNEIWTRAEYPESSISCEAAKEVILKEIREQLKALLLDEYKQGMLVGAMPEFIGKPMAQDRIEQLQSQADTNQRQERGDVDET